MEKENKINIENISSTQGLGTFQTSSPLFSGDYNEKSALAEYTQSMSRPKYDKDVLEVIEVVRILNNMAPIRMPEYNFNLDEINGERFYKPDGSLLLVREWASDVVRDYYASSDEKTVLRILEHDKKTGRLRTKIEPLNRENSRLKTNITIFDEKINNKYIIMQLSEGGIVNNISEFTGRGKSFQTLFRNIETFKPVRYLEGKDKKEEGFAMLDCLFDVNGGVARIRRYTNKKEINIDYTEDKKNITVKNKY